MKSLILGGVRSGKSRYAEILASAYFAEKSSSENVILLATATAQDDAMSDRIAKHQASRPASWRTVEEPLHLSKQLIRLASQFPKSLVLIDCLTLWLTNLLMQEDSVLLREEILSFEQALMATSQAVIMVSNETNMGITPLGELTRQYCDEIGALHQKIAAVCDHVDLVVAGLPLSLK